MSVNKVSYPGVGCLVEFMQGNSPMQAVILEEQGDKVRVYALNRRESKIALSRLLPWSGPALGNGKLSRQSMDEAMEERRALRASISAGISALEIWELAQGEVDKAPAEWLAGLVWERPTVDQEAAMGHALLAAKSHFRFNPPDFEIFPEAVVAARAAEAEALRLREAFAVNGAQFFQKLRDIAQRKRGPLEGAEEPDPELAARLKRLLLDRIADPDAVEDAALWKLLIKSLPESPHQALILASAWGLVPEHYNFYLDRIGFDRGDDWAAPFADEAEALRARNAALLGDLPPDHTPFVSVDPPSTRDRDDAFFVRRAPDGGFSVDVALACPALAWPFGGPLDKAVVRRASSLYLPEGDQHMLPADIGRSLFSLDAGQTRPALVASLALSADGELLDTRVDLRAVDGLVNLNLEQAEGLLRANGAGAKASAANAPGDGATAINTAGNDPTGAGATGNDAAARDAAGAGGEGRDAPPLAVMFRDALELSRLLQGRRIAAGAVITERPDPEILVEERGGECVVRIEPGPEAPLAHLVVGEMMILCNSALAAWGLERDLPLLFRTQDVALPREFAGIWTAPQDISRVVRALPPASLEAEARRHAGLGLAAYAAMSSPIRRYADLLNQGQVASLLRHGRPLLSREELKAFLPTLSARADAVNQVQRLRPRYWKLLFFRNQGDRAWWDGVVADENDAFATIALPWAHLLVRGKRRRFGDKIYPGMAVQVRLGKIDPLLGEVQVLEAREA